MNLWLIRLIYEILCVNSIFIFIWIIMIEGILPSCEQILILPLKVIPRSHSSATWCYMANASMWCLPTNVQKEGCVGFHYRNDKESHIFQWQNPLILQHFINISIKFFNKSTHSFVVLINYL